MTEHRDDIEAQLKTALERQAENAPRADLADASLLQAGRIRRKRRIATGIATLALAAVAVPIATEVAQRSSTPTAPATQGPETTQQTSAGPQPSQSAPSETLRINERPLLGNADVNPVGTSGWLSFNRRATLLRVAEKAACLPRLAATGATRQQIGGWVSDLEATFYEAVLQMPTAAAARELLDRQRTLPQQCGDVSETRRQTVSRPAAVDVGGADEALAWTVVTVPLPSDLGSEDSFFGVAMARRENVVVVVAFNAFTDPTGGSWEAYGAQTLRLALDRALR